MVERTGTVVLEGPLDLMQLHQSARAGARACAPTFTALWKKTSQSSALFASTEIGHWNRWIANSTIKAMSSVSCLIHAVLPAAVPHQQTAQTAGWHRIHLSDVRLAEGLVNGPETDSDVLTNRICCTRRAVHKRTPTCTRWGPGQCYRLTQNVCYIY